MQFFSTFPWLRRFASGFAFVWGPTMNQVFADLGNNFANAVNGQGTLSDALNAVQQSTITFMKSQGFSVSPRDAGV